MLSVIILGLVLPARFFGARWRGATVSVALALGRGRGYESMPPPLTLLAGATPSAPSGG